MDKVNITEYKMAKGEYVAYYARATVGNDFMFLNGDEAFYHFIGKNSGFSLMELIYPDDEEDFKSVLGELENGRQCTIVRLKDANDKYRLIYCEAELNGRIYGGFKSFDLAFTSFMELTDRYVQYVTLVTKYRSFMGLSDNMFMEYNPENDILNIYRYAGLKSVPLVKKSLAEIKKAAGASSEFEVFYGFLQRGVERFNTSLDAELLFPDANGECQVRACTLYDNGKRSMTVGIVVNTGVKKEKTSFYLTDAALDAGTGLYNKRAIQEYAMERTQAGKPMYLAMMDVDDFKKVNDSFGHMFGDEVLSKVSETMRSVITSRGMVGRFGGDEFMVVLDGVSNEEELRRILKTISKNLQWEFQDIKDKMAITTSCGVARFPDDASNYEDLFKKADKALYIAKEKGKNRFIIYDEKKHGSVEVASVSERSIGIKAIVSDVKKGEVVSDLTLMLNDRGFDAFPEVMEMLRNYIDIDGIAVYAGEGLRRVISSGKYINPIEELSCILNDKYLELFDEQGVYVERGFPRLKAQHPEVYGLYELQENKEYVQCIAKRDGKICGAVSFDYFNRAPKIGAIDMGFIRIAGRLMAQIAACI